MESLKLIIKQLLRSVENLEKLVYYGIKIRLTQNVWTCGLDVHMVNEPNVVIVGDLNAYQARDKNGKLSIFGEILAKFAPDGEYIISDLISLALWVAPYIAIGCS